MPNASAVYFNTAASAARKSVRWIIPPFMLLYSFRTKDATESTTTNLIFLQIMSSSMFCNLWSQDNGIYKTNALFALKYGQEK